MFTSKVHTFLSRNWTRNQTWFQPTINHVCGEIYSTYLKQSSPAKIGSGAFGRPVAMICPLIPMMSIAVLYACCAALVTTTADRPGGPVTFAMFAARFFPSVRELNV